MIDIEEEWHYLFSYNVIFMLVEPSIRLVYTSMVPHTVAKLANATTYFTLATNLCKE